jgi:hypothetical protein
MMHLDDYVLHSTDDGGNWMLDRRCWNRIDEKQFPPGCKIIRNLSRGVHEMVGEWQGKSRQGWPPKLVVVK